LNKNDINCDLSFDQNLKLIEGVNRLPWVGKAFYTQKHKIFILGESIYNWKPEDQSFISHIEAPDNLRNLHVNHAMNFKKNSKFVRNIERAIYNKKKPTDSEKNKLWTSVIYHNLVKRVLKSNKHRPSYNDYLSGWTTFGELVDLFLPDQVIVYGLERKKIDSFLEYCQVNKIEIIKREKIPVKVGRSHPRKIVVNKNGKEVMLLFIKHPSSYFSWKKWSPIINHHLDCKPDIE